jgi:hypothetical protein
VPGTRLARTGEAGSLTALCARSKAHWGYDTDFMRRAAATMVVREDDIAAGRVLVAVDARDAPVAVAAVVLEGEVADLDLLFVDPPAAGWAPGRSPSWPIPTPRRSTSGWAPPSCGTRPRMPFPAASCRSMNTT